MEAEPSLERISATGLLKLGAFTPDFFILATNGDHCGKGEIHGYRGSEEERCIMDGGSAEDDDPAQTSAHSYKDTLEYTSFGLLDYCLIKGIYKSL